jgi:lipopolysaccharide transport system ATP-binding protein
MKPAIRVEGLTKQYHINPRSQRGSYQTLREVISSSAASWWNGLRRRFSSGPADNAFATSPNAYEALKDVSFEVQPGEVIGLIGRNGAGKSTLLKVLSRITEPTHGRIELRGRVGSLLEVGTGFHPELTGRENIYLNGSILGMSRREINRKFDEIVGFAEMDRFLDTPVKRYSSGMYVRLAFAVAAHLDLEILLVDEVLAVGDLEFQKKCLAKMGTIAEGGRTVIFVSHNLGLIHRLCSQVVLLHNGQVQIKGPTAEVVQRYLGESLEHDGQWQRPWGEEPRKDVCLRRAAILDKSGRVNGIVNAEDSFQVEVEYEVCHTIPNFEIGFSLRNAEGVTVVVSLDSDTGDWSGRARLAGSYRSTCRVPGHLLAPGTYFFTFAAHIINQTTFDCQADVMAFEVSETGCIRSKRNDRRNGVIMPVFDWDIKKIS